MAAAVDPVFAVTPVIWSGLVPGTADTSRTAPTNVTTLGSAGANGTKIEQIRAEGVGTTVAGICCVFLYDGTTYHLFDEFAITAVTPSTTVTVFTLDKFYENLVLPSGWSLRVTNQIAGNVSLVKFT